MTRRNHPLGRPHAPRSHEPVTEYRNQEEIESTTELRKTDATGLHVKWGRFLPRRIALWLGFGVRFRIRQRRGK